MYTVIIEGRFSATHRVQWPDGTLEPLHGHDWQVRAAFSAPALNEHGMVVDFHEAQSALNAIVEPFEHSNLNEHAVFGDRHPTAEVVARHLFDELRAKGLTAVSRVEVVEAPGCVAAYEASQE